MTDALNVLRKTVGSAPEENPETYVLTPFCE